MPSFDTRQSVAAVLSALRWAAVMIGCLFAADTALAGELRGVVAVGLGVLVAVWWTVRPQPVNAVQDVIAALVLVAADLTGERLGAFVPAVVVALVPLFGRRWLPEPEPMVAESPEPELDLDARLQPHMTSPPPEASRSGRTEAAPLSDPSDEIVAEERRRAGRLHDRVAEWLTYVQIALDRHLNRKPDYQLAKLRDEVTESIREVEERSRQLRARVTASAPLASHSGRLLEWWSHHYGGDVTLRITDPDACLGPAVEQQLLTILQEAVDNVGRHAGADQLDVLWEVEDGHGRLRISDDGSGFDAGSVDGRGLAAMRRAAQRAGADLEIESRVGHGTTVTATVAG
jgi:signal transduction histidine kinase